MFKDVRLRNFSFAFSLIPTSQDEAEEILLSLIIKFEEQQLEAKDQEKLTAKQKVRLAQ